MVDKLFLDPTDGPRQWVEVQDVQKVQTLKPQVPMQTVTTVVKKLPLVVDSRAVLLDLPKTLPQTFQDTFWGITVTTAFPPVYKTLRFVLENEAPKTPRVFPVLPFKR